MSMIINCIAIDDEPPALKLIGSYIEQTAFLKLAGKFDNAMDAMKAIYSNSDISLVFLDIRMPELSGIELARVFDHSDRKKNLRIIFTTAYNQYALDGFKVAALDYLLKPFNYTEFFNAANKALDYFTLLSNSQMALKTISKTQNPPNYIYVKVEHQLIRIDLDDILYIEGLKDYVKIYTKSNLKPILTILTFKKLEERLPASGFLRVHRSYIIAKNAVKAATRTSLQIGETTIQVSEQYKAAFNEFIGDTLI